MRQFGLYIMVMQDKKLLLPTNDFVFKKVFAENTDLLASLLAAALNLPEHELQSIVVLDAHLRRETIEDKDGILDIKVQTISSVIDVEIQVRNQPVLGKRIQYYLSSLYIEQLNAGDSYAQLNKAVSILIVDFSMYDDAHWHHRFRYYDNEHDVEFKDSCEILVLELPKVGLATGPLADWLRFVNAQNEEDFMEAAAQHPLIGKAYGVIKNLSYNEEMRLLAQSREKALRDAKNREDGVRMEEKMEIAKNFLMSGTPQDVVAKNTGLSMDEVAAILEKVGH